MERPTIPLGLGTAAIGRPQYINIRQKDASAVSLDTFRQQGWEVLEEAYRQGIRYFDTAPGYGLAEPLLLDWVKEKADDRIEVATKWGYTYLADFDPNATQHELKEHSLSKLNEQWLQSKHLLPYLTTYQIHSATFETGVLENEEILNRLAALKAEYGLKIGLTTTGAHQLAVLKKALAVEINGDLLFEVFQVTYNVFDQSLAVVVPYFEHNNRRLVIKEALANGRVFPNKKYRDYEPAYQKLQELAKKYDVGIDAIALNFCINSLPVYKVLSGAAIPSHLSDNLKADQIELSEKDLQSLKVLAISPEKYWKERKQLGWN